MLSSWNRLWKQPTYNWAGQQTNYPQLQGAAHFVQKYKKKIEGLPWCYVHLLESLEVRVYQCQLCLNYLDYQADTLIELAGKPSVLIWLESYKVVDLHSTIQKWKLVEHCSFSWRASSVSLWPSYCTSTTESTSKALYTVVEQYCLHYWRGLHH